VLVFYFFLVFCILLWLCPFFYKKKAEKSKKKAENQKAALELPQSVCGQQLFITIWSP